MLGTRLTSQTKIFRNNVSKLFFSSKPREHMTLYHNKIDATRTEYRVVDPSARKVRRLNMVVC